MSKRKSHLHHVNVLAPGVAAWDLWQFEAAGEKLNRQGRHELPAEAPLPAKVVRRQWSSMFQGKLNLAWFPADQVFLRVLHLPAAAYDELVSMAELQLEKISPLPVNQIVWSIEPLSRANAEGLQTVVVLIADRTLVEEFVGTLEARGYMADRLELPVLHEFVASDHSDDGAWIYPVEDGGKRLCLVAWWQDGRLHELQLLQLPPAGEGERPLIDALTQTAWTGEMQGWLKPPVRFHLVATPAMSEQIEPALRELDRDAVRVLPALTREELALLAAKRSRRQESRANLLPGGYSTRYRQEWIDGLWMTGLGALLVTYIAGVLIYIGVLQVFKYQQSRAESHLASLKAERAKAVKLKEHVEVLQNQLGLKYAALDCLLAASQFLPAELTLTEFTFTDGEKLFLRGRAPLGQSDAVLDYNESMRIATAEGRELFASVDAPGQIERGQEIHWNFTCALNLPEAK